MRDAAGNELIVGDYITYATKVRHTPYLKFGKVVKVLEGRIQVRGGHLRYKWNPDRKNYDTVPEKQSRASSLNQNTNGKRVIRIEKDQVPKDWLAIVDE